MGAARLIIEDVQYRPDLYLELRYLWENRREDSDSGNVSALSITFLSKAPRKLKNLQAGIDAGQIIAQAIVVSYPLGSEQHSYVYEANICLPRHPKTLEPLLNNYLPMARDLKVRVNDLDFAVKGIYFCQQNGSTTFCCHSALKILAYGTKEQKLSAERLDELLKNEPGNEKITLIQLTGACESLGMNALTYDFTKKRSKTTAGNPWTLLSSAIEAEHPSCLIFQTGEEKMAHILPVIGYTINSDEWHPHASDSYRHQRDEFLSSSEWIDHLIVNDDVTGPLYCLSQSWLKSGQGLATIKPISKKGPRSRKPLVPVAAIAILPNDVNVSATLAEKLAHASLGKILPDVEEAMPIRARWWRYLLNEKPRYVLRTTIIEKERYFEHLSHLHRGQPKMDEDIERAMKSALPDVFWSCEISLPNLYAGNRAKLGEILISPTGRNFKNELEAVSGFRLPGVVGWTSGHNFSVAPCNVSSHSRIIGTPASKEW